MNPRKEKLLNVCPAMSVMLFGTSLSFIQHRHQNCTSRCYILHISCIILVHFDSLPKAKGMFEMVVVCMWGYICVFVNTVLQSWYVDLIISHIEYKNPNLLFVMSFEVKKKSKSGKSLKRVSPTVKLKGTSN